MPRRCRRSWRPRSATASRSAVDRLRGAKAKSKVLILLTDGDCNAGVVDPREAARIAAESGIRLYTIGIGRSGTVPVPQEDEFGNRVLVPAQFRIDEELLREMAQTGHGRYFHASDSEGLAQVYAEIDKLEKTGVRGDEVLGVHGTVPLVCRAGAGGRFSWSAS